MPSRCIHQQLSRHAALAAQYVTPCAARCARSIDLWRRPAMPGGQPAAARTPAVPWSVLRVLRGGPGRALEAICGDQRSCTTVGPCWYSQLDIAVPSSS